MNLEQVRRWRPDVVADVADALSAQRQALTAAATDNDVAPANPDLDQRRPGESPAQGTPDAGFVAELDAVIAALNIATDTMRHVVEELEGTFAYAEANGCAVDLGSGRITLRRPGAGQVRAAAIERFEELMGEAISADADLAAALQRAGTDTGREEGPEGGSSQGPAALRCIRSREPSSPGA